MNCHNRYFLTVGLHGAIAQLIRDKSPNQKSLTNRLLPASKATAWTAGSSRKQRNHPQALGGSG